MEIAAINATAMSGAAIRRRSAGATGTPSAPSNATAAVPRHNSGAATGRQSKGRRPPAKSIDVQSREVNAAEMKGGHGNECHERG